MNRCPWAKDEINLRYHDEEWGVPVLEDKKQFEFLVLESAQAGLSWSTVLKKRENYRAAFAEFDPVKVAEYGKDKIEELLQNPGIIRNRKKIEAAVNNAQQFLAVQKEFGSFTDYIWGFVNHKPVVNTWTSLADLPARTDLSERVSKDMVKRGFRFLGPIVIYSHLQAVGIVNDHLVSCFRYREILEMYEGLKTSGRG